MSTPAVGSIQQHELRAAHQGPGQEDALLLPTRKFPYVALREVRDAQSLKHLVGQASVAASVPGEEGIVHGASHQHYLLHRNRKVPVDGL